MITGAGDHAPNLRGEDDSERCRPWTVEVLERKVQDIGSQASKAGSETGHPRQRDKRRPDVDARKAEGLVE